MKPNVDSTRFHIELARELFQTPLDDDDVFCLMLLLHACIIRLSVEAQVEGGVKGFEGITSRHIAEVAASLFSVGDKADPDYWYHRWNDDFMGYAVLENIPDRLKSRLRRIKDAIELHPWVEQLENDDWEILAQLT